MAGLATWAPGPSLSGLGGITPSQPLDSPALPTRARRHHPGAGALRTRDGPLRPRAVAQFGSADPLYDVEFKSPSQGNRKTAIAFVAAAWAAIYGSRLKRLLVNA